MDWIRSLGGPLILLPLDSVPQWAGSYGPAGGDDCDEEETPYWHVSEEVTDFAEAVDVGGINALVLANGDSPTCFLPSHNLFVQRLATGSESDLIAAVVRSLPSIEWQHSTEWVCSGPSLLFDSARYGPDVGDNDGLRVNLQEGAYSVRCTYRGSESAVVSSVSLTMLTPLQ